MVSLVMFLKMLTLGGLQQDVLDSMGQHVACFILLTQIMDIFLLGEDAIKWVARLQSLVDAYVKLYGTLSNLESSRTFWPGQI